MAVISEFSADKTRLTPSSELVTFTDESTGSPNTWLWDFGDGEFSEDQHPTHTYIGESGDKFTVKLKAINSPFPAGINRGSYDGFAVYQKGPVVGEDTPQDVIDSLDAASYQYFVGGTLFQGIYNVNTHPEGGYAGFVSESVLNISLHAPWGAGPSTYFLKGFDGIWANVKSGTCETTLGGRYTAGQSGSIILDITALSGQDIRLSNTRPGELVLPVTDSNGVSCTGYQWEYPTNSADDIDDEEKVEYIQFGIPPIAEFTGSPLAGGNPVSVQFENLTTESEPGPTTYSWKRRKTGSGDAFTEFSTEKNPLTDFGK